MKLIHKDDFNILCDGDFEEMFSMVTEDPVKMKELVDIGRKILVNGFEAGYLTCMRSLEQFEKLFKPAKKVVRK